MELYHHLEVYNNTAPILGSNGLSLDVHFPLGIDFAPLMGLSFGVNGSKELIRKTIIGNVVGGTASANYTYEKDANGRVTKSSNTIISSNGQTKTRTISCQY
jgi:hypothetical protein